MRALAPPGGREELTDGIGGEGVFTLKAALCRQLPAHRGVVQALLLSCVSINTPSVQLLTLLESPI